MRNRLITALPLLAFLIGCSVNPVTGKRELVLVSEAQELQMGASAYLPSQQSQGGVYDIDPELTEYVRDVGHRLAAHSDRQLPYEFVVLNNSVPNAWALPGGKIAINRGLLTELNSEAELAAVLGHEIVHAAARHSAQQATRGLLGQVLVVATAVATSDSDYGGLATGAAGVGAQLSLARYGRGAELESDHHGMRYMSAAGYDPQGAVALQETFVRLSEDRRSDWLTGLFASHPPSQERVAANRATAATLPRQGRIGTEEYRRAMRRTLELKPAYDAYDEGRKALAEKKQAEALTHANEAIDRFPGEAHFHALRGDIRFVGKNYNWAITNYTRAIERRGDFFYYHLQRGLARREAGQTGAAASDLERANQLMETAPAHYALGQIAESRGQRDKAIAHYKVIAKSQGEYGKAATAALVRLELPTNPGAYMPSRCDIDGNYRVVVTVKNSTPVTITGIKVVIRYLDSAGLQRQQRQSIGGTLSAGRQAGVDTSFLSRAGASCQVQVIAARVAE